MARKKVTRALAPLPNRRAFEKAHHKTEALINILRDVAVKNQQEQPRAFHSVRDVAAHFRVPVSTVSRVYRHLEQEGLLSRVRGSKTLLQGLKFDRQLKVRAFVGFPASLSSFVTLQDYRTFLIRIRRELRLRGFAAATAFFEPGEGKSGALTKRFQAYEVDRITVVQAKDQRSDAIDETVHTLLDDLGIAWSVVTYQNQRSEPFLRDLVRKKTGGIIFTSSALVSKFCFRAPNTVADLLQAHRVALVNGPVSMPFARVPEIQVDLITVDWQLISERIVDDLITQDAFQQPGPTIFEAEAKPRVPLSAFAQSI